MSAPPSLEGARSWRRRSQVIDYIWTGLVALFLLGYLTYALLHPERF